MEGGNMDSKNYEYFMEADVSRFTNEWIAIVDQKIVSHGKSVKEVLSEVKHKYPGKTPLIARIPGEEAMIL